MYISCCLKGLMPFLLKLGCNVITINIKLFIDTLKMPLQRLVTASLTTKALSLVYQDTVFSTPYVWVLLDTKWFGD